MAEIAESNAAVNADIPPYNTIHTKAATCAMHAFPTFPTNANLTVISKVTCMLMQVCVCPGRERMLRCLRACDSDNFKPEEDHSRDVLDAFRAEHECDAASLSTVLFTNGEPTQLVIGVHVRRGDKCSEATQFRWRDYHSAAEQVTSNLPVLLL